MQKPLHCTLAAAALLLAAAPVEGFGGHGPPVADTTLPLVATGGGAGVGGWATLTLQLDGTPASVYLEAINVDYPIGKALHPAKIEIEVQDPLPPGARAWDAKGDYGSDLGHVASNFAVTTANGQVSVGHDGFGAPPKPAEKSSFVYKLNTRDDPRFASIVGKVRVVLVSPAPAESWTWTVRGGAQVLAQDAGDEVFAYTSEDFEGTVNGQAKGAVVQAHAVAGSKIIAAENTLFVTFGKTDCNVTCKYGNYLGVNGGPVVNSENAHNWLSVVFPSGKVKECTHPLTVSESCYLPRQPAGRYTFLVTGLDGGVDPFDGNAGNAEVYLYGADVRLTPW